MTFIERALSQEQADRWFVTTGQNACSSEIGDLRAPKRFTMRLIPSAWWFDNPTKITQ